MRSRIRFLHFKRPQRQQARESFNRGHGEFSSPGVDSRPSYHKIGNLAAGAILTGFFHSGLFLIFDNLVGGFPSKHKPCETVISRFAVGPLGWRQTGTKDFDWLMIFAAFGRRGSRDKQLKGLILAQNERWRRGLGMQVER
jgi:hypothetical protein